MFKKTRSGPSGNKDPGNKDPANKPTQKVGVGFEIRMVKDVDCVGQSFFSDFTIYLKWYDETFKSKRPTDAPIHVPLQEAKVPAHYIVNVVDLPLRDESTYIAVGDPPGIITYEAMYTGILSELMELEYFPLDSQDLSISVRFKETHVRCQTLMPKDKFQRVRDSVAMAEWLVYKPRTSVEIGKAGRACWTVQLRIYRQADYYVSNVILPMTLFSCGTFASFLYEPDDWYSRSCHILQILLAYLALKFVIMSSLPKVSFFTLLDLFLFPTYVFIFGMISYCAVMKYFFVMEYFESGDVQARDYDIIFALCCFIFWLACHVSFFATWNRIDAQQRQKNGEESNAQEKVNIVDEFLKAGSNLEAKKEDDAGEMILLEQIKGLDSVGVGFEVRQVKDVDCLAQTFFSDFSLILKFYNQSVWSKVKSNSIHLSKEEACVPEHYIANAVKLHLRDEEVTVAGSDPKGVVTYTAMYTGILFEFMELEFFPMDLQDLTISVRFQDTKVRCKTLGPPDKYQRMRDSIAMTEWCMFEQVTAVEVGKQGRALWSLKMKIYRQWGFYFWNVLLPVSLFCFIAFFAFLYDADDWYSRSCHDLMVILAVVTFKFIVADQMPKVPFMVVLDLYMFPSFVFLLGLLAYFAFMKAPFDAGYFEHGSQQARKIDLCAAACLFFFWLTAQVIFAIQWRKVDAAQRSQLGKMLDLPSQTESVNIASVLFSGGSNVMQAEEEEEDLHQTLTASDIKARSPVGIGFEIRQVKDIDCISQVFWVDFTIYIKYYNEKLSGRQSPTGVNLPLKIGEARVPVHYISNAVDLSLKDQQVYLQGGDEPGVVTYEAMYLGLLSEFMELEYFPLDAQDLSISVRFQETSVTCRTLGPADKWQRLRDSVAQTDWEMYNPKTTVEVGKQGRSTWSVQLKIYRKSGYYQWQVMLPMSMFSLMAFYSFLYVPEQWYEKSTHTINVLLLFVTFKFVIAESMPKVPFFVLLDMYMLPNFCFLVLMVVEFGVFKVAFLLGCFESGSSVARMIDLTMAAGFFGVWAGFNAFFITRWGWVDAQQRCSLGSLLNLPTQIPEAENVLAKAIRTMMYGPTDASSSQEPLTQESNLYQICCVRCEPRTLQAQTYTVAHPATIVVPESQAEYQVENQMWNPIEAQESHDHVTVTGVVNGKTSGG